MPKTTYTLESGQKVSVSSVPAFLIERVQSRVPSPSIPIYTAEDGAQYENPTDPEYLAAVQAAEARRVSLSIMAAIVYGVELIDDEGNKMEPPNDGWETKLKFLGIDWRKPLDEGIALGADEDMSFARDASYLLYWLMTQKDIEMLMKSILVAGGGSYDEALATFQGDSTRNANRRVSTKRGKRA